MTTTNSQPRTESTAKSAARDVEQASRNVADTVAGAAGEIGARIPEVAQSTQDLMKDATRAVQRGSDPTLQLVGAMSIGLAVGLLAGGANRIIVLLSLIPGALIGATLLERRDDGPTTKSTSNRVQGA
jgi:hypothetical protein